MDSELKKEAEALFSDLGMNISTAFNIFVRQALRTQSIPFPIISAQEDFYNPYNQERLQEAAKRIRAGKGKARPLLEDA